MRILAVGMRDIEVFGVDQFYLQMSEDKTKGVTLYSIYRDWRVKAMGPPSPLSSVTSTVEKFNGAYYVQDPVEIHDLAELPKYLGKFEMVGNLTVRLKPR